MKAFCAWIGRRARAIVLGSGLLAAAGGYYSVHLYRNLRTDMEELLPQTARSVVDLSEVTGRLESSQSLAILVLSDRPDRSKRFVTDLATAVERDLADQVARVEYRIDREVRFFDRRKALFMDLADLRRIRDYVRDRIDYERALYNPLNIFSGVEIPEPMINLQGLRAKYAGKGAGFTQFKDGYYASPDARARAVLVYPFGKASGIGAAKRLRAAVDGVIARLDPASYDPGLRIHFSGDVQNLIEEHDALMEDLALSTAIVTLLVTLAMLVFYRNARATAALLASLLMGTLWTFGAAWFAVGYLNANSAFLGSIVIGNGVNFGIIILARYLEERRRGSAHGPALETTLSRTVTATLTAALAAGLAYGSLMLTQFRGFRQFGVIGLMGMLLCWVSAFVTLPAMLSWLDARGWLGLGARRAPRRKASFSHLAASLVARRTGAVLAASALLATAAAGAIALHRGQVIETDTSRLRSRRSMEQGSGHWARELDRIFRRYLSPLVILPRSEGSAERIAERLKEAQRRGEAQGLISQVYSVADFVPADQRAKVAVLREIRDELKPSIRRQLGPRERRLADEMLTPEAFRPFGLRDLPESIRDRFRERDGSLGKIVLLEPKLDHRITTDADAQYSLISTARGVADSVEPGAPVVGQLPITVDMYQSVRRDGPRATAFALAAVVLLVVILFRRPAPIALALAALFLGGLWLAGSALAFGWKINFLNFIALPITFGIGVDYGVNILQRYRLEGRGSALRVVRGTGAAVALASLTTIIGYGSLLLAQNRAFVSFGRLAVLGEITCLLAAILTLPSYLYWRDLKGRHKQTDKGPGTDERSEAEPRKRVA